MFSRLFRFANPLNRAAIAGFIWSHRRSIMRWGRSFWHEVKAPSRIDPSRLALMWRVLWSITRDDRLAKAKQLRSVRLDGDTVVVDAASRWKDRSRLVDRLERVEGVSRVVDAQGLQMPGTIETTAR